MVLLIWEMWETVARQEVGRRRSWDVRRRCGRSDFTVAIVRE